MSAIELHGAHKRFGSTKVLEGLDLSVPDASITAILGPSGSGKTTLLRILAGFEQLDAGELRIAGRLVDDTRRSLRPQQRGVGYVPQDGALFPHLTVLGNIAFGLSRRDGERARRLAERVGLGDLRDRYPHQLSGGQQRRVALARALAIQPRVVLLDEPFSSLDASLRLELRGDVARILRASATAAILVTHDQDEAMTFADQIALLSRGRLIASGPPRLLYDDPPDVVAARSIGEANILAAEVEVGGLARCALGEVAVGSNGRTPAGCSCRLLLRPEQLILHASPLPLATEAVVERLRYHGHETLAHVRLAGSDQEPLIARISGSEQLELGQTVWVTVSGTAPAWRGA